MIVQFDGSEAEVLAWLSLAVAVATFLWTIYWSYRIQQRSQIDDYWFKGVVGPHCVDPLLSFWEVWSHKIGETTPDSDENSLKALVDEYASASSKVKQRIQISRMLFEDWYQTTAIALDGVEDAIADEWGKCAKNRVNRQEAIFHVDIIKDALDSALLKACKSLAKRHSKTLRIQE